MSSPAAATRATRRDMFRAPGRLIAAVLLIALPIAAVVALAINDASGSGRLASSAIGEQLAIEGVTCEQEPGVYSGSCTGAQRTPTAYSDAEAVVPDSIEIGRQLEFTVDVAKGADASPTGTYYSPIVQLSPDFLPEDLPTSLGPDEIFLDKFSAESMDISVGDSVTTALSDGTTRTLTVAAISPSYQSLVIDGALYDREVDLQTNAEATVTWLYRPRGEISWADVEYVNARGGMLLSNDLAKHPPADAPEINPDHASAAPTAWAGWTPGQIALAILSALAFYAVFALLIVLFISPVFSLALARHTRLFAMLSAQGASRWHIAAAVLVFALFAGAIGATLGVVLGGSIGWAWWAIASPGWSVHIPWINIGVAWLVAVLGSITAAAVPAYLTARNSLAGALAGGTPDRMVRWRWWMTCGPALLVLTTIGALVLWFAHTPGRRHYASGEDWWVIIVFVGLVAMTLSIPALVFWVARTTRRAPVALRTAGRGLTRRSLHTLPAVAAIAALTTLVVGGVVSMRTDDAQGQAIAATYTPSNVAFVDADSQEAAREGIGRIAPHLGPTKEVDVYALDADARREPYDPDDSSTQPYVPAAAECATAFTDDPSAVVYADAQGRTTDIDPDAARACLSTLAGTTSYTSESPLGNRLIVASQDTIEDLFSLIKFDSPEDRDRAAATLRAGGVVINKGHGLADAKTTEVVSKRYDAVETADDGSYAWEEATKEARKELPVAEALPLHAGPLTLVSEDAARELGVKVIYAGTALLTDDPITRRQDNTIREDIYGWDEEGNSPAPLAYGYSSAVYRSYNPPTWPFAAAVAGLSFIALALVIALAAAGIRRESRVFASLGAAPGFAAKVAALQAGLVAALGLWTGILAGHVGAFFFTTRDAHTIAGEVYRWGSLPYYQPSWLMMAVGVVVPLVTAALAWWVHRPRLDAQGRDRADLLPGREAERSLV